MYGFYLLIMMATKNKIKLKHYAEHKYNAIKPKAYCTKNNYSTALVAV